MRRFSNGRIQEKQDRGKVEIRCETWKGKIIKEKRFQKCSVVEKVRKA